MATDPISNCYIYTNYCSPAVKDSALHLAAYNGRTVKFRQLLTGTANDNIHVRTRDRHNCSLLSVALARGHRDIAAICLDHLEADLAHLDRHFAHIGGAIYASHFWLQQQVLVVHGATDVQHARTEGATLLMDPADAVDRKGVLMLLKPEPDAGRPEVLWLTARHSGDDRRLATLISRCWHRDGLLHLTQQDVWDRTDFQIAARRNLRDLWTRMHSAHGKHWLSRRQLATSFRLLAEHQPAAERVQHFRELCRTVGGFEPSELFAAGPTEADEALQTFQVLQDALAQFNGDMRLIEYLVELGAARLQRQRHLPLAEAIAAVIDMQHPTARGRHRHSLMDETFKEPDNNLQWLCLRFGPSLRAKSSYYMHGLLWTLIVYPDGNFEAELSKLITSQLRGKRNQRWLTDVFGELCYNGLWQTAQVVWSMLPEDRRRNIGEQDEQLMADVLRAGHFDTFRGLVQLLRPTDRLRLLAQSLRWNADKRQSFPAEVWSELLAGKVADWRPESVGQVLCAALQTRQMDVFERVWNLVGETFTLKDAVDAANVPILFHAIYDAAAQHHHYFTGRPGAVEPGELIDSDDDDAAQIAKTAINAKRLCRMDGWRPPKLIVDAALEASYLRVFRELIAAGANIQCLHPATGCTLLHTAARRDNLAVAGELLELGIPPSAADSAGNVAMSLVRSAPMVALLPAADVHHVGALSRRQPLGEYLGETHTDEQDAAVVAALLAAGADCNYRSPADGKTALLLTANRQVAEVLLAAGADVDARVLWHWCRVGGSVEDGSKELLWRLLRQPGLDVWQRNAEGQSLLGQLMIIRLPVAELRELEPQLTDDQAELERLFTSKYGAVGLLKLGGLQRSRDPDDLRCLRTLLELDDVLVELWGGLPALKFDRWRQQLECGAHISRRTDKRPLDWSQMAEPHTLCNEIEFFARAGFEVDYRARSGWTALQGYCATQFEDGCEQMALVARLVAAGADYRLRRQWDRKPVLEGMVLECLYEWDEERGVGVAQVEVEEEEEVVYYVDMENESDGEGEED